MSNEIINRKPSVWTRFMDMSSGGHEKEPFKFIYIEAGEEEAKCIFTDHFEHDPENVTCACCGPDYAISESVGLDQASGYERGCEMADGNWVEESCKDNWRLYSTLEEWADEESVCVLGRMPKILSCKTLRIEAKNG